VECTQRSDRCRLSSASTLPWARLALGIAEWRAVPGEVERRGQRLLWGLESTHRAITGKYEEQDINTLGETRLTQAESSFRFIDYLALATSSLINASRG
jgi:hypothetical protein